MKVYNSKFNEISLGAQLGNEGGEGIVFEIDNDSCAKIFSQRINHEEKHKKIKYMVNNQPATLERNNMLRLCWPTECLYNSQKKFVGFKMLKAYSGSILLDYFVERGDFSEDDGGKHFVEFNRNEKGGIRKRALLCTNLSAAIHLVHKTNKYVLVDLKPKNILVTKSGKISVLDMDSIQINNGQKVLFYAAMHTPHYTPRESQFLTNRKDFIPKEWDYFSLSVIFYQIFLGIHPFSCIVPEYQSISELIQNQYYVYGKKAGKIKSKHGHHKNIKVLPSFVQDYFLKALDGKMKERPSAADWGKSLYNSFK